MFRSNLGDPNSAALGASYGYDEDAKYMISYYTLNIVRWKSKWIEKMGFGGGMWWEIYMDKLGGEFGWCDGGGVEVSWREVKII
jgi:chitinase